jgi:glutamine synthetase
MSLAFTNTVLNTIVAEAIDDLAAKLEAAGGEDLAARVIKVVTDSYLENNRIIFDGDGYSDAWQQEAEKRGLKNLRTTPDALPEVIAPSTIDVFGKYNVLNERELEARYEVWVEQYAMNANIEAETAASIARTLIIPAVAKHLVLLGDAEADVLEQESRGLFDQLVDRTIALEKANGYPGGIEEEGMELAVYARDKQLAAMHEVRVVADKLERIVADHYWPLPKYSEMMFIK